MLINLPVYAVQRSESGRWLVWAPDNDPCAPAVRCVAVLDEPDYRTIDEPRSAVVIRSFRSWQSRVPKTPAGNGIHWPRDELLQVARLLDRLDVRDIERFCVQRRALSHELRRLARWAPRPS